MRGAAANGIPSSLVFVNGMEAGGYDNLEASPTRARGSWIDKVEAQACERAVLVGERRMAPAARAELRTLPYG